MNTTPTLAPHDMHRLLNAEHDDPFSLLGMHETGGQWLVRAFRPDAKELTVIDRYNSARSSFPGDRIANEGLFEARLTGVTSAFDYLLQIVTWSGEILKISDPYSYGPILGELDMHLFKEGNHYDIYKKLGAHLTEINGHPGVSLRSGLPTPSESASLVISMAGTAVAIRCENV